MSFLFRVPLTFGLAKREGLLECLRRYDVLERAPTTLEKITALIRPYVRPTTNLEILSSVIMFEYFNRTRPDRTKDEIQIGESLNTDTNNILVEVSNVP